MIPVSVNIGVIVALLALEAAIIFAPFCREVWKAGGVRNLCAELKAELKGTALATSTPVPQPPQAAVPWWERADGGLPARTSAACWEPAEVPEVTGVPPWDAAAPSQGTGYTRYHAAHLQEVLGRAGGAG